MFAFSSRKFGGFVFLLYFCCIKIVVYEAFDVIYSEYTVIYIQYEHFEKGSF